MEMRYVPHPCRIAKSSDRTLEPPPPLGPSVGPPRWLDGVPLARAAHLPPWAVDLPSKPRGAPCVLGHLGHGLRLGHLVFFLAARLQPSSNRLFVLWKRRQGGLADVPLEQRNHPAALRLATNVKNVTPTQPVRRVAESSELVGGQVLGV